MVKRILLHRHCSHHLDAGDVAMVQVAATRFAALVPAAELGILTEMSDELSRSCSAATPVKGTSTSEILSLPEPRASDVRAITRRA